MARWFTFRRFLAYSAYFAGVISLVIGLFIGKNAWAIHQTIRVIEKSWNARDLHHRHNASWIDKAVHALVAGHEDVSEYNDLFWEAFHQLEPVDEDAREEETSPSSPPASDLVSAPVHDPRPARTFDRSNLTTCQPGHAPTWVTSNAAVDKWGFVVYRTSYDESDEEWAHTLQYINDTIRTHLELEATHDGMECDPDLVRDRAVLEIVEDRALLDQASYETVRALWRQRVDGGLVDATFKIGGWQYGGWFRVNLGGGAVQEGVEEDTADKRPAKKTNGLSLNTCLVYDNSARFATSLSQQGFPATGPRDPWEPYLVAIDGLWDAQGYLGLTSWTHGYQGYYGVALSILFNDYHGEVFEREPERSAPRMWMGGPTGRLSGSWLQMLIQIVLDGGLAVARPGAFPFDRRWQEIVYPFLREDSHWDTIKQSDADPTASDTAATDPDATQVTLDTPKPSFELCGSSPDNQEGCFMYGNMWVRSLTSSKTTEPTQPTEQPATTEELLQTATTDSS